MEFHFHYIHLKIVLTILTGIIPLTVNYYDNYSFTSLDANGSNLIWATPPSGYDPQYSSAKGLLTGTRTYILDKTVTNYLTTALYYDDRGRIVQSRATNHLGGFDFGYNHYDFTGKVITSRKDHNSPTLQTLSEVYRYGYDKAGRLKLVRYNGFTTTNAKPCYNGNITYSTWKYNQSTQAYTYTYDPLNRLMQADAYQIAGNTFSSIGYNELFGYDKQGNLNLLQRKTGTTGLDNLTYTYTGNQLNRISDSYGSQNQYTIKE